MALLFVPLYLLQMIAYELLKSYFSKGTIYLFGAKLSSFFLVIIIVRGLKKKGCFKPNNFFRNVRVVKSCTFYPGDIHLLLLC